MLPTINLQPSDFAPFDTDFNAARLLPQDATEPAVTFAELLKTGKEFTLVATGADGQLLPSGGNDLPLPFDIEEGMPPTAAGDTELNDQALDADAALNPLPLVALMAAAARRDSAAAAALPSQAGAQALPVSPGSPITDATEPGLQRLLTAPVAAARTPADAEAAASATRQGLQNAVAEEAAIAGRQLSLALQEPAAPLASGAANTLLDAEQRSANRTPPAPGINEQLAKAVEKSLSGDNAATDLQSDIKPQTLVPIQATATPLQAAGAGPDANALQGVHLSAQPGAQGPLSQAATSVATSAAIDVPVKDSAWGEALGQRVQVMASHRLQTAEIRLTPAELGPLRIQVAVDDGRATVTFHAAHAVTRDAIEQALPRLREMLADSGLTLGQASVGEQGVAHGGREGGDRPATAAAAPAHEAVPADAEPLVASGRRPIPSDKLVDTFA